MNILCNIFGVFIFLPLIIKSQLIIVQPEKVFESPWIFNPEYIAKNNIKKIHLQILDKKDFQSPEDLNRQMVFEYDKNGREIFSYTVEPVGIYTRTLTVHNGKRKAPAYIEKSIPLCDTLFRQTSYTDDEKIKFIRTYGKNSPAVTSYFTYYNNGFIKEIKCREWAEFASGKIFVLQKQEIMFIDSFQTLSPSEKFKKNVYFNSDKKPYKEQHYEYENQKLKLIRDVFVTAPWIEQYKKFEYENNKIKKAMMYANTGIPLEYEYEYQYDEKFNLYTIYFRKNKFLEKEIGFVNDSFNGNAYSIVIRNYILKTIQIIKIHIITEKSPFAGHQ